jgi:integrase
MTTALYAYDRVADLARAPRPKRTLLAVLGLSGLRNAEATALEWRHVDFTHNRIVIGDAKTQAGRREVQISPFLRRELEQHRLGFGDVAEATGLVFPTRTGRSHSRQNVNNKIVHPVVALADVRRAERGDAPLPSGITAHTFRRTYVTLCAQFGRSLAYVQSQVGHTDVNTTNRHYLQGSAREAEPAIRAILRTLLGTPE